jgi:K+-transporting ATPase ATPase C chain
VRHEWRPAVVTLLGLMVVTGLVYPLVVTGISQVCFNSRANGSLLYREGKAIGSKLIGQPFEDPAYFWGRPSATGTIPYDGAASTGSNLGPSNPALLSVVTVRVRSLRASDPDNHLPIPVDLVTASASGLDPHISLAAARYQVGRVARARGLSEAQVDRLIEEYSQGRSLGVLGEPVVRVVELNLALDRLASR